MIINFETLNGKHTTNQAVKQIIPEAARETSFPPTAVNKL